MEGLSTTELIKKISLMVLIALQISGAEKDENASNFNVVTCKGKKKFQYIHKTFDCFQDGDMNMCENLGLFVANKKRCYKCCMALTTSTRSPTWPSQMAPIARRGSAGPVSDQTSSNQVYKILVICSGSIFAAFAIIVVGVIIGKNQSRWKMKLFGERGCGILHTGNIGQEENALEDIRNEAVVLPVQEEAEMLVPQNTEHHFEGMPIVSSRETNV